MGDSRRMYTELKGDLSRLSASDIASALEEIASGTGAFGPMREWTEWYHYLLAQLLPRGHEARVIGSLLELLVTGFIALYPNGVHRGPYKAFAHDALNTLGRVMMDPRCWSDDELAVGSMLHRSDNNPARVWCWWDASGDFSASLFFCLKYLPEPLVRPWFRSALEIPSPHWRAQMLVWLVGAHGMLTGRVKWPDEFTTADRPSVSWEWSHCLRSQIALADESGAPPQPAMLPEGSCLLVLQLVRSFFTEERYLEWLYAIERVEYLIHELAEIPGAFEALYVERSPASRRRAASKTARAGSA